MADDIQNEMNALRNEFNNTTAALGKFTNATVKNTGTTKTLDDWGKRAEKETFEMVGTWDKMVDAGKEAIKALISFQGKLADGDTSFSSLGDIVDGISNAAGAFQNQLSKYGTLVDKNGKDTHKKVGILGTAVSGAAGVIQKYGPASKILLAEMDKQVAAYQELSKVGATTATGITGMQDMAGKAGLPFQKFVGAIAANSEALAMMGGTAGQGAEKFAEMTQILAQGTDDSLRYIGMGAEQIAAASGKYMEIQAKQGKLAGRSSAQLAKDSQEYLLKLKRLSLMTGMSIDKLEESEREMAVDNQFQAFLTSLPPDQADKARQLWREFNAKGMGKEAMSAMMGGITKSGQQFLNTMGTSILSFRDANKSVDGIVQQSVEAGIRQKDQIALQQQYTDQSDSAYMALTKVLAVDNVDPAKQQKDADAALDGMINNTDQQTKDTVESQKNMEKQAILTQKAMFKLMPAFTAGVAGVTGSMETIEDEIVNLCDKIEQITGIKVPGMDEWRKDPMNAMAQTGKAVGGYLETRAGQAFDATKQFFGFGDGGGKPSETFKEQAPTLMKNLMSDFKLTKEQAAGIVGNLGHESAGLKAGIQEKNPLGGGRGGLGWAQWTGSRRRDFEAYLQQTGQSASDPNANYGFLKHELQTSQKGALSAVRKTGNAQEAMMAFEGEFERAGVKHYESRAKYAQQALALADTPGAAAVPTAPAVAQSAPSPKGLPSGMSFADASRMEMAKQPLASAVSTPVAAPNGAPTGVSVTPPVAANNPTTNTGDPNADVHGLVKEINNSLKEVTVSMASLDNKTKEAGENIKKVKENSKQAHA